MNVCSVWTGGGEGGAVAATCLLRYTTLRIAIHDVIVFSLLVGEDAMSIDALFQLGIVSVALNTSQTEDRICRSERHHIVRAIHTIARRIVGLLATLSNARQQKFVLPHAVQIQMYSGRMPS